MSESDAARIRDLTQQLAEASETIQALLSGQIDAVVQGESMAPLLLSKAQTALRESEERYRCIVETASEGIATHDANGTITFVNPQLAAMLGYRPDEIVGQSFLRFTPPAMVADAQHRAERSLRGLSNETAAAALRKDGAELPVLLRTSPLRDVDGNYVGTLSMMTDRTQHRAAEEALRRSEEQYRQIVETTSDGIVKIDAEARVAFVNRRFAEMLGYQPEEMVGRLVFDFMNAEAKAAVIEQNRRSTTASLDTAFQHRDGTQIWVNIAATRLYDASGRHVGNLGMVRDVTERKKLQAQLMVSDRMASVGTLAAGVAHEINNPLAAVIANLEYIASNLAPARGADPGAAANMRNGAWLVDEILAPLDDAREAAQRVRFIVRDLKIFSRSPVGEVFGSVNVKAVIESALRMAWNEIRHRAKLVKLYGDVPNVHANEARLGQVVLNLIMNAAQAIPEGRAEQNEIRVTTRCVDGRVVIEVADTGVGIAPDALGRIFDAFYTTKAPGAGTGLGLAICQRIVTDIGGELTVTSTVGVGTTFRVALLVAQEAEDDAATSPDPVPVDARHGRILVVDDESLVLRVAKRVLGKQHDVVAVNSAPDALALCASGQSFDLILCDVMMPDMTGMDLYHELLRVAPEQAKRIIFLTGGAFTPATRQFLLETAKEHIEKPFDPANLRAIVQRHLQ